MIKTKGSYEISLDGGKTFSHHSNILLSGYYNVNLSNRMAVGLSTFDGEPTVDTTNFPVSLMSPTVDGFATALEVITFSDRFEVTRYQDYFFGVGNSATNLSSVCLIDGRGVRVSLSRLKDSAGNYIKFDITSEDNLYIRYRLTYIIPRAKTDVTVVAGGVDYTGKLQFLTPNKWGTDIFGTPVTIYYSSLEEAGHYTVNPDGYVSGSVPSKTTVMHGSKSIKDYKRVNSYIGSIIDTDYVKEVSQIAFYGSNDNSASSVVILIELDTPIVKGSTDIGSIGINIVQDGKPT